MLTQMSGFIVKLRWCEEPVVTRNCHQINEIADFEYPGIPLAVLGDRKRRQGFDSVRAPLLPIDSRLRGLPVSSARAALLSLFLSIAC